MTSENAWSPAIAARIKTAVAELTNRLGVHSHIENVIDFPAVRMDQFQDAVNCVGLIYSPRGDVAVGEIDGIVFVGRHVDEERMQWRLSVTVLGPDDVNNAWRRQRAAELRCIVESYLGQFTRDEVIAAMS